MTLLKSLSLITSIMLTGAIMFFMQRKKFKNFMFRKILEERINDLLWNNNLQKQKNNSFKIPELPNPNWIKIGKVVKLCIYPIASAGSTSCRSLKFTHDGVATVGGGLVVQDRMFYVYNTQTKRFQNPYNMRGITLMNTIMRNKSTIQFKIGESCLSIDIDKEIGEIPKIVTELKAKGIVIKYIDCGEKLAKFVSRRFYASDSILRIVRAKYIISEPTINTDLLEDDSDNEALEQLADLMRYIVITYETMKNFIALPPQKLLKIQQHIMISAPSYPPFAEKNWEWIRIGNVIMRKIMPVSSLKLIQESFKNENECDRPPEFLGIFYELYSLGNINVKDDVFLHISQNDL